VVNAVYWVHASSLHNKSGRGRAVGLPRPEKHSLRHVYTVTAATRGARLLLLTFFTPPSVAAVAAAISTTMEP